MNIDVQGSDRRRARLVYGLLLGGAAAFCAGFVLAPLLRGGDTGNQASELLYRFYRPICHQLDGRSFHLGGAPLAVCFRCSSIYIAFLLALAAYPMFQPLSRAPIPRREWLFAALAPMVVDVGLAVAGLHDCTTWSRVATGGLFGLTASLYVLPIALDAARLRIPAAVHPDHHQPEGLTDVSST